jgi:hypothetical protein
MPREYAIARLDLHSGRETKAGNAEARKTEAGRAEARKAESGKSRR